MARTKKAAPKATRVSKNVNPKKNPGLPFDKWHHELESFDRVETNLRNKHALYQSEAAEVNAITLHAVEIAKGLVISPDSMRYFSSPWMTGITCFKIAEGIFKEGMSRLNPSSYSTDALYKAAQDEEIKLGTAVITRAAKSKAVSESKGSDTLKSNPDTSANGEASAVN